VRLLPIILLALLAVAPFDASARGAAILVIDGFGSSYVAPGSATYADGAAMQPINLSFAGRADAAYELEVPVPATEYGHVVIVTGYANASPEMAGYYHATIFDALRDDGYLALGILENGDSKEMLGELDACVHNRAHSVYDPDIEFIENGHNTPSAVAQMMERYPVLSQGKAGKDPYVRYMEYNAWALGFATALVDFMNDSYPDTDYVLIVNAGGLDSGGHNTGYEGYRAILSEMDAEVGKLIDVCAASDTILMITGDHGMSFKESGGRGSHAAPDAASRKESLVVPLLVYADKAAGGGGTCGQECLAPTLLSLLDEPDTLSLCDGKPLPVKDKPSLFINSEKPVTVTVTGVGFSVKASFTGTCRLGGLDKGDYTVHYGGAQRTVHLAHDELICLEEYEQAGPLVPPWIAYTAIVCISATGILVALKLAWSRK